MSAVNLLLVRVPVHDLCRVRGFTISDLTLGDWTSLDKTSSQGEEEDRVGELHGSWIVLKGYFLAWNNGQWTVGGNPSWKEASKAIYIAWSKTFISIAFIGVRV